MFSIKKFDPSYGYNLEQLLSIEAPPAPSEFKQFWQTCYAESLKVAVNVQLKNTGKTEKHWRIHTLRYNSTDGVSIGGWLLTPTKSPLPKRAFIVGHGYGGRDAPDFHLPFDDAALLFPCCRGISQSPHPPISSDPKWHILHDIDKIDRYILRGCVEDTWLAVSCILKLYPYLEGKIGYLGTSFTGGIGAIAMAWENRVARAHFNVPSFGHHRLRLKLPTYGSGNAVQRFFRKHPRKALRTLRFYDAANAAEHMTMPAHFALALKDAVVAPPGQFAIYNAKNNDKQLFVLDEGHASYRNQAKQEAELLDEIVEFFS